MIKKLSLFACLVLSSSIWAQNFVSLSSDGQGDDHYMDAKALSYALNSSQDTLSIKISHYNARSGDFGYAICLDTNGNVQDGYLMLQNNLRNQTPNNSMKYDVAIYAYQNGFFPGLYTEAYGDDGMATTFPHSFDTADTHFGIFKIPLSALGGKLNLNIVGFTGSFDISPVGAGPGDAIPDANFSALNSQNVGVLESTSLNSGVYPNPSSGIFHLENLPENEDLTVFSLDGRMLLEIKMPASQTINLERFKPGIYILKTKSKRFAPTKLVIE